MRLQRVFDVSPNRWDRSFWRPSFQQAQALADDEESAGGFDWSGLINTVVNRGADVLVAQSGGRTTTVRPNPMGGAPLTTTTTGRGAIQAQAQSLTPWILGGAAVLGVILLMKRR